MRFSTSFLRPLIFSHVRRPVGRSGVLRKTFFVGSSALVTGCAVAICSSDGTVEDLKEIGIIRFGRAAFTVAKIVVDYKSSLGGLDDPSEEYNVAMRGCHQRSAERLLGLARDNGGVFIKVGQHLAAMEYLVPQEYTKTLSVLMSRAPQQSLSDVKFVLEAELQKPIEEVFSEFSEKPVGAASLAQVHTARLKETGEKVAVKVQHRRVYENSQTDIRTMHFLVTLADKLFPEFHFMWLVDEIKKNLPNELDFIHEAKNADKARAKFAHLTFLKIPTVHYELTTRRVLTMEFCEGAHFDNEEYMVANKIDRHDTARKLGRLISEMIFLNGYLHSDPHPGNVMVNRRKDGGVEIVLLDHGLYLEIDDRFRDLYSEFWLGLLNADQAQIKKTANEMGVGELYGLFACMVTRRSWKSVTQGIGNSQIDNKEKQELREYAVSLIPQISEVLSRMPREMLLILKTNDLLRNMEHLLQCSGRQDSMIEMSKCVIRSHHELALKKTQERLKRLRIHFSLFWSIFKIRVYELYLIFADSVGIV